MNIALWTLQVILALHTAMGAAWKLTNPEQMVPSLSAIPHSIWQALSVIEFLVAIALIAPAFRKSFGKIVPFAALLIEAEMIGFTSIHTMSGDTNFGPVAYWLVVAALSGFLAFARFKLKPIN